MDEESSPGPTKQTSDDERDEEHLSEQDGELEDEMDDDHCSICLQLFTDRSILIDCAHEFCFECIVKWTGIYSSTRSVTFNL